MENDNPKASLKKRLLVSTIGVLIVSVFMGGAALTYLFEQHVERRVEKELHVYLDRLIKIAIVSDKSQLIVDRNYLAARFLTPYSGLYWQINAQSGQVATSSSLWDERLELPDRDKYLNETLEYTVKGPGEQELIVVRRHVTRQVAGKEQVFQFAVGLSHFEVTNAVREFSRELTFVLTGLAFILALLLWMQIRYGLRPLRQLIPAIDAITSGKKRRFSADYPLEVAPLIKHLNSLLKQQEMVMERSRARAASLAHGLKTPLAGISVEIHKLQQQDKSAADKIYQLVARMNRQIERELIRTRIRGSTHGIKQTNFLAPLARNVISTLVHLPRGNGLSWELKIPDQLAVAMDTDDIAEILGNILDNSRKWAQNTVLIEAKKINNMIDLSICDDGAGLNSELLTKIKERGMRFDDSCEGSGLGLTIVHDIVVEYGGEFLAYQSNSGGLGIQLLLPAA